MKFLVAVKHWTDRPLEQNFLSTLSQFQRRTWETLECDAAVFYHGRQMADLRVRNSDAPWWATRVEYDRTNVEGYPLNRLTLAACTEAIDFDVDYDGLILMDDDAYIRSPELAVEQIKVAFSAGGVCCGPATPYRMMARYKCKTMAMPRWIPDGPSFTTLGCQVYRTSFLKEYRNAWECCYRGMDHLDDAVQFLLARANGLPTFEFYCDYSHRCSHSSAVAKDRNWALRHLKEIHEDTIKLDWLRHYVSDKEYLERAIRILGKHHLKPVNDLIRKNPQWGLWPVSSFDYIPEFIERHTR